jgi:predicted Ser/Thr protein kinase
VKQKLRDKIVNAYSVPASIDKNETDRIGQAINYLETNFDKREKRTLISFNEFLDMTIQDPSKTIRSVFQIFYELITTYIGEGVDEYPDDTESIKYLFYDCSKLLVDGLDNPFFADRPFANRLVKLAEAMKQGVQQNKIYIFEGPHGSGKSTFLTNLLLKFEDFANTEEGARYETVWLLDPNVIEIFIEYDIDYLDEKVSQQLDNSKTTSYNGENEVIEDEEKPDSESDIIDESRDRDEPISSPFNPGFVEVPCPSHDHPILMIPKQYRRQFFDNLLKNDEFKWKLYTEKQYDWIFRNNPCTICSSIFQVLLDKLQSIEKVFRMLYTRKYRFNRRIGEGISVFNPGDPPMKRTTMTNTMLQERINKILMDSNLVRYIYSTYTKTNNGIYALMDIKNQNVGRFIPLHNIISDGIHKVEYIEENIDSLFLALLNPEDKHNIKDIESFSERIEYINIPYVLDIKTEINIYSQVFGEHIKEHFLRRVLHNFARVIIASRLNVESKAMKEWINDPKKYSMYCDENLHLLKMEIYVGNIPEWLTEEDRKKFTAKVRRKIITESETEGDHGLSGRDSIKLFGNFYSTYAGKGQLINMAILYDYFTKYKKDIYKQIPEGFLDSLTRMYNYSILQEVKESLFNYNEEQISRNIMNYMFAVNFESGAKTKCNFTGDTLEITEDYFKGIEHHLLGYYDDEKTSKTFRNDTRREYTSKTFTQEIMLDEKKITETDLYNALHDRYVYNLKEKVLDAFLDNENFRRAIKDYDTDDFKTYDSKIKNDVTFLMNNLSTNYEYSLQAAKEICMYAIDNNLVKNFDVKSGF